MTNLITADKNLCTQCGLCIKVCPMGILTMDAETPVTQAESCMACGHCVAVCPTEAITNRLAPLQAQEKRDSALDPDRKQAAQFLRGRRSVRWFREKPLQEEELREILNIGAYAPTAGNSQGVSWLVIENRRNLKNITAACVRFLEENFYPANPHIGESMKQRLAEYHEKGTDIVLLGAPCLAIALSEKDSPLGGRDNAVSAMNYIQLYAHTAGIGICWAGIVEVCARSGYRPLLELLDIPEGREVQGAMMVGYPRYGFRRIPERNMPQILRQK